MQGRADAAWLDGHDGELLPGAGDERRALLRYRAGQIIIFIYYYIFSLFIIKGSVNGNFFIRSIYSSWRN